MSLIASYSNAPVPRVLMICQDVQMKRETEQKTGTDQTIYTRGAVSGVGLPSRATDWSAADLPVSCVRELLVSFMTISLKARRNIFRRLLNYKIAGR